MAAEAQRAPSVRGRTTVAARLRPCKSTISSAHPLQAGESQGAHLRIFPSIPPRHGVIAIEGNSPMFRTGEVAVYDELWSSEGVIDGGLYVLEYQHPRSGMSWECWDRHNAGRTAGRSGLDVSRTSARVVRSNWPGAEDDWMIHPLAAFRAGVFTCSDGPLREYYLADKIIGKIVGIYSPASIGMGAAA